MLEGGAMGVASRSKKVPAKWGMDALPHIKTKADFDLASSAGYYVRRYFQEMADAR